MLLPVVLGSIVVLQQHLRMEQCGLNKSQQQLVSMH
jgi:hypothetical protein